MLNRFEKHPASAHGFKGYACANKLAVNLGVTPADPEGN